MTRLVALRLMVMFSDSSHLLVLLEDEDFWLRSRHVAMMFYFWPDWSNSLKTDILHWPVYLGKHNIFFTVQHV